jgi:DNA-binding beta-propeller fold protein YncE
MKGAVALLPALEWLFSGRVYHAYWNGSAAKIVIRTTPFHSQVGEMNGVADDLVVHPDGTRLYALSRFTLGGTVKVYDLTTNSLIATLPIEPDEFVLHPDGTYLFVSSFESGTGDILRAIDTATNQVVSTVAKPSFGHSDLAMESFGGSFVAIGYGGDSTPGHFDAYLTDLAFTSLPTSSWPAGWWPEAVATGPFQTYFTVDFSLISPPNQSYRRHRLSYVSWFSEAPIPLLDLPDATNDSFMDAVMHPDGTRLYASIGDDLYAVDTNPAQVVAMVPNAGGDRLAVHPLGQLVYSNGETGFRAISTSTHAVMFSAPGGGFQEGVAVKP